MEEKKESKLKKFITDKNITKKKIIKATTMVMGLALIVFMTLTNVIFDPNNLNFFKWLSNSLILTGIMIFGIIMGESIGDDELREKANGKYQRSVKEYKEIRDLILPIDIYFSQFYLWYKENELKNEKLNFLMDNQIDGRWAKMILNYITKEDLIVGKFILDENNPNEKIYIKNLTNGKVVKIKKANSKEAEIIRKAFEIKLETYGYNYYLSYEDDGSKGGKLRQSKKLNNTLLTDKRMKRLIKIITSLVISVIWGMATIQEFSGAEQQQAWFNLLSRLTSLVTSLFSGWTTAVLSIKTLCKIIDNKRDVLKDYKNSVDNNIFIPETYEEMVEREYNEQISLIANKEIETT